MLFTRGMPTDNGTKDSGESQRHIQTQRGSKIDNKVEFETQSFTWKKKVGLYALKKSTIKHNS